MFIFLQKMVIDEDKLFHLSRYMRGEKKDSDHHTLVLDLNINFKQKKTERIEFIQFSNSRMPGDVLSENRIYVQPGGMF